MADGTRGERIAQARRAYPEKMTQTQLGKRVGKSREMIARYETGRDDPPLHVLQKIADVLKVRLTWLLEGGESSVESGIEVVGQPPALILTEIPYWGEVPAGDWQAPGEDGIMLAVDHSLAKKGRVVLRVAGDSMYPRLHHGDHVIVHLGKTPKEGVLTLARNIDNELTIKVLRRQGNEWHLQPINPDASEPLSEQWEILGYVISIERHFGPGRYLREVDELGVRA